MTSRTAVKISLTLVLGLPVLLVVLVWVASLLAAMGDVAASSVLEHIGTAVRVLWLIGVVGLVIALAFESLEQPPEDLE